MAHRRNEFDVTDRVNTTDTREVYAAVCRIYEHLYQRDTDPLLLQAFRDFERLYRGEHPHYHGCDTDYHDIQHVLDVTLAMARLMDGYVRATSRVNIDERLFCFGVITALFHDFGYLRHRHDTRHRHGAEYTRTHVSRGAHFLREYLPTLGMADLADPAAGVVHFTGYEIPIRDIRVDERFRPIGNLLGSADMIAQMADRCYLEKCRDRLYPEFVYGGIARPRAADGTEQVVFGSAAELIYKTPAFYEGANRRLAVDLQGYYAYVVKHFGGQNLYVDELEKNINHARTLTVEQDVSQLRRQPPVTLKVSERVIRDE
ncbi:MAG TPA: hypothetical protein VLN59_11190 [Burkholderiales bacterium]|nr:hypothetical protein [Burkholderiales bacterium]